MSTGPACWANPMIVTWDDVRAAALTQAASVMFSDANGLPLVVVASPLHSVVTCRNVLRLGSALNRLADDDDDGEHGDHRGRDEECGFDDYRL